MALSQSMGIAVPKMSLIVNRTTRPIDGMFNGQPLVLPPGYKVVSEPKRKMKNGIEEVVLNNLGEPVMVERIVGAGPGETPLAAALPDYAAEMIKRQNVVMGTEDPENFRDVEYLIGCEAWGDPITHLEQTEAIERYDRSLMDDKARDAVVRGGRNDKRQRRAKFTDERLANPAGIRGDIGGD